MGRPPKHDADKLLDAALALVAESGPPSVTMAAVARKVGAPSGSVYHRFPDRPALLAALWSRTLGRFQAGLVEVLSSDPPMQAAVGAARYVIEWSSGNPSEARVLLAGAAEFGVSGWSPPAQELAKQTDAVLLGALRGLGQRLDGADSDRLLIALVDLPYATVRRYLLAGKSIPPNAPDLVEQAVWALLSPLDSSTTRDSHPSRTQNHRR
jgi:AcrR family transcriptional regulator